MLDIICLGETLIDFTPAGKSAQHNDLYECNPGGSVANFAVAAAQFGASAGFMGKVGNDTFGRLLGGTMESKGVDTSTLVVTDEYPTTVAFVHLFEDGDRDFTFYRQNGADANFRSEDINFSAIDQSRAMHIASLTMTNEAGAEATLKAFQYARDKGLVTTYDPNWRPRLWNNEQECQKRMGMPLKYAQIVKCAEEELAYIMDETDELKAAQRVLDMGPSLLLVTRGARGSSYYCAQGSGAVEAFAVKAVDTTGSGDCFFSNAVMSLLSAGVDLQDIDIAVLEACLRYASAAAALCATVPGGMPAMPNKGAVLDFIERMT